MPLDAGSEAAARQMAAALMHFFVMLAQALVAAGVGATMPMPGLSVET